MYKLNEVSRKNLVGKTKVHSPARYNKRLKYSTMSIPEIDEDKLMNEDMLVIRVRVGQYSVTVAYEGAMKHIIELVERDPRHRLNRRIVVRALNEQVDAGDVYVRCSCPDFQYRFGYYATKFDYIWGTKETRPSNITNPHDSLGAVCKHLACVLANKQWLVKAASVVNEYIHDNYEEICEAYNINEDTFYIDEVKYQSAIKGVLKREMQRPPAEIVGATSKLYEPNELEERLFNLLDSRGWFIRVDTDLDRPVMVYLSKSADAIDNPDETEDIVYRYEVKPAGTKVRLQQMKGQ